MAGCKKQIMELEKLVKRKWIVAVPILIRQLESNDLLTRKLAAHLLVQIGTGSRGRTGQAHRKKAEQVVLPLMEALLSGNRNIGDTEIAQVIYRIGEPALIRFIEEMGNKDRNSMKKMISVAEKILEMGNGIKIGQIRKVLQEYVNAAPPGERIQARREAGEDLQRITNAARRSKKQMGGILLDGKPLPPRQTRKLKIQNRILSFVICRKTIRYQ